MAWKFFTSAGVEKYTETQVASGPGSGGIGSYSGEISGLIAPFAGSDAPTGWLLCQGQEVQKSSYPDLAEAIGTTYGPETNGSGAAGTTHFRLPDLRGRVPIGQGQIIADGSSGTGQISGSSGTNYVLGAWGGSESVTLTGAQSGTTAHSHSISAAAHSHTTTASSHSHKSTWDSMDTGGTEMTTTAQDVYNFGPTINEYPSSGTSFAIDAAGINASMAANSSGITSTNNASAASASSAHTNVQSMLIVNYIVKT